MAVFYEIFDDMNHPTNWWLGEVKCRERELDFRALTRGEHFDAPGSLTVAVRRSGTPAAFTLGLFFVPIVRATVADILDTMAHGAIERIPVRVEGREEQYEVLNVVRVLDAIDRERSRYLLWKPEDGRPDKLGKFRQVEHLVVKGEVRQAAGIFRPSGWTVALIVSAQIKQALERSGPLGVRFRALAGGFTAN